MIYTIGHKESYDSGLLEHSNNFKKLGKTETYAGGIVFPSFSDAKQFLLDNEMHEYDVYGLVADWHKDTNDGNLINTSQIIKVK